MKILYCWPAHDFSTVDVARGLHRALAGQGVELIDYRLSSRIEVVNSGLRASWLRGSPPQELVCDLASQGLAQTAILSEPDWVLIICGMSLHPNSVLALRRIGLKVACWFTEGPYNLHEELRFAALCDVALSNERSTLAQYQAAVAPGGRAAYLPHAYDPAVHRPDGPLPIESDRCDVLFVGTGFGNRQRLFEDLDWAWLAQRHGARIRLRGFWPGVNSPSHLASITKGALIQNDDTAKLYRGAKIVLNIHRGHAGPIIAKSMNPRTLEVAANGAFQVCDDRAEVAEVFGDSVPRFDPEDPWELMALLHRALADEPWRMACAAEARRRVAPHTFEARARRLLETLSGCETTPLGATTPEYVPVHSAQPTPSLAAVAA